MKKKELKSQKNNLNKFLSIFAFFIYFSSLQLIKSHAEILKTNEPLNLNYLNKKNESQYILGPGDIVSASISSTIPQLDGQYFIDGDGKINLPKINRIYVSGLTIEELIPLLNQKYNEFIKFPEVKIAMLKYRPVRIYIDGEVEYPGLHTLENLENQLNENIIGNKKKSMYAIHPTLFDAIRTAGGITESSDLSNVEVIRINPISNGGGKVKTNINFINMIENGYGSENIRIYDGDVIKIYKSQTNSIAQISKAIKTNLNPLYINAFISGRVYQPGQYQTNKTSSLNDLIDMAGGVKTLRGNIVYIRFQGDGNVQKSIVKYNKSAQPGSKNNPLLRNGDIVRVGKGPINHTTEVIAELLEPVSKVVQSYAILELLK